MKKLTAIILALLLTTTLFSQVINKPGSGECLKFNGTSNRVECNFNPIINSQNLTIELWVNTSATGVYQQMVTREDDFGSGNRTFQFRLSNSGVIEFAGWWGAGDYDRDIIVGNTSLNDGNWHHVAVTWDGVNCKFYIDGVLDKQQAVSGNLITSNTVPVRFACSYNTPSSSYIYFFDGKLDEIKMWSTARTQAQLRKTMCQKLIGNEVGLLGYWRFDEGIDNSCTGGEDVCDATTNGNSGTKF